MKKVILTLSIAAIAVIACNKEDDNLNVNNLNSVSNIGSVSSTNNKANPGGYWTPWIYDYYYDENNQWNCKKGNAKNCSKWVPNLSTMSNLDNAINLGPNAIANFFLNDIEGTELESIKDDREIYAKFISGSLYAEKIVSDRNITYRFYEIIDNNEVNFVIIQID